MSKINYDLKKIKAFAFDVDGVLSPATVDLDAEGNPIRKTNLHDGLAIRMAINCGYDIVIISHADTPEVINRFIKLGLKHIFTGVWDKELIFKDWILSNGLTPDEVAYMGDDLPDLKCMKLAGLPCAPYDAVHEILESAIFVSKYRGGYGCVRDLIEQTMRAHGEWKEY